MHAVLFESFSYISSRAVFFLSSRSLSLFHFALFHWLVSSTLAVFIGVHVSYRRQRFCNAFYNDYNISKHRNIAKKYRLAAKFSIAGSGNFHFLEWNGFNRKLLLYFPTIFRVTDIWPGWKWVSGTEKLNGFRGFSVKSAKERSWFSVAIKWNSDSGSVQAIPIIQSCYLWQRTISVERYSDSDIIIISTWNIIPHPWHWNE